MLSIWVWHEGRPKFRCRNLSAPAGVQGYRLITSVWQEDLCILIRLTNPQTLLLQREDPWNPVVHWDQPVSAPAWHTNTSARETHRGLGREGWHLSRSFLQASSVPHHHLHGHEMELQLLPRRELLWGRPWLQLPAWIHRTVVGRTEGYLILFTTYVETPGLSGVSSRWPSREHKHKHNQKIIPLTSTTQKQIYVSGTVIGKHIQIQNRCTFV